MGKNQHSKDKLYLTPSEWKSDWGGKKEAKNLPFKRLPFHCCALSLSPFTNAVCSPEGNVFELVNIIPYIKQFKKNPVTGSPLTAKQLTPLTFHKNAEGQYHCPVTFKVFTDHTHIVAVRTSGHVYSGDAIDELCRKPKNWKDLITGEPFTPRDLVTIQDPYNLGPRTIEQFQYVQEGHDPMESIIPDNDRLSSINAVGTTQRVLKAMAEKGILSSSDSTSSSTSSSAPSDSASASTSTATGKRAADAASDASQPSKKARTASTAITPSSTPAASSVPAPAMSKYSTGAAAASFTSTAMNPVTQTQLRSLTDEELRLPLYERVKRSKKKGYVRIVTNLGPLNVELHSDVVPKTCDNFIQLCESGYYNGTTFHRLIRNFMIQGGDPTGTGRGGQSIWKRKFKDEIHPKLRHSGRGILSMANSGPHTNGSQFFITLKACEHLDNKHSVFGQVVGGLDTLTSLELIPTDGKDKPKEPIRIESVDVFVNPYTEAQREMDEEEQKRQEELNIRPEDDRRAWFSNPTPQLQASRSGVGKYLKPGTL